MRVVLRSAVEGLGKRGDVIDVADGHGRNYLIPQGLAMRATKGMEREAEAMRRAEGLRDARDRAEAEQIAARIGTTPFTIAARASDEGRLFGSVSQTEIIGAAEQAGITVERQWIEMDEPIKEIGDHSVTIRIHTDVAVAINVAVIPDES